MVGRVPYLVASLSLSDQNEGIGAYNGEAEVDEDNGALGADVPRVFQRERKRTSLEMSAYETNQSAQCI